MGTLDDKKVKEKQMLQEFLGKFSSNPGDYHIKEFESPDFIIELNDETIAIEMVEYFNGDVKKALGSIERCCTANKENILNKVKTIYESKCTLPVCLNFQWTNIDFSKKNKKLFDKIANEFANRLLEIMNNYPSVINCYNNIEDFVKGTSLGQYISYIDIVNQGSIGSPGNIFNYHESGYYDEPIEKINSLLTDKNKLFDQYVWNLVSA